MRLALFVLVSLATCVPAGAQSTRPVPAYDITVRWLPGDERLDVDAQVTVVPTERSITALELRLDRRCSDPVVTRVPAGDDAALSMARRGGTLTLSFSPALAAGEAVALRFRYSIGAAQARSFYVTGEAAFISGESFAWYPLPSSERRARGRLRFLPAAGLTVAATGRRVGAPRAPDFAVEFVVDDPTTFSFAAGRHQVHQDAGSPALALHLLRPRPLVRNRLELLRRVVSALVTEFGAYPHPDLEIVEMPVAAAGGRDSGTSLEGFVVVGPDVMESFDLSVVAHEVSHQWWADCVFGVGESSALISETMAEYGVLLATEALYGEQAAAHVRWKGYPGQSLLAGGRGYLSLVVAGLDAPLTTGALTPILAVNKGMLAHDLFSRTMGREAFRDFLRAFFTSHAFTDTSWKELVAAAQARFGDVAATFVRDWYGRAGVPEWELAWTQQERQLRGTIVQRGPFFEGAVEISARGPGGQRTFVVAMHGGRSEFSVPVEFTIASVLLDPDYKVPHRSADRMTDVRAIAPLGQAFAQQVRGGVDFTAAAKDALAPRDDAPPEQQFLREAILAGEALERGDTRSARTHLRSALASPSRIQESLPAIYYREAALAAAAGERDVMAAAARSAIDIDAALVVPSGWGLAARELLMAEMR